MEIIPVESGPVDTIGYLVIDSGTRSAILIDTPYQSSVRILKFIKDMQVELKAILLTHTHWDHTADAAVINHHTNADVYVHEADAYRLSDPQKHTVFTLPFKLEPVTNPVIIQHGDSLAFGSLIFDVVHTPGHTEGGVCFLENNNKVIFTGDTIFYSSIGRTDLPGGDYKQLIGSINERLLNLPDDYNIYPGHGEPSSIGVEKINNPFLNGEMVIAY
jgi:glyoxylase-like metal-dependent hydrolase (beta-lactamase superfamily II)